MRLIAIIALWLILAESAWLRAQTAATRPTQTARQALIEMFLGRNPDDFTKHLPEAARELMSHGTDGLGTSTIFRLATYGRRIVLQGENIETFDTGPAILIREGNNPGHDRFEVTVEHDAFSGDTEEIEISAHFYHEGEEQVFSFQPRLIFTLKQEKDIWRLIDLTVISRVPLTDPSYLKSLRKEQEDSEESAAQMRMVSLMTAETDYATNHPERGYACTLTTLFAQEPGDNSAEEGTGDEDHTPTRIYYDPGNLNKDWNGYRFIFSGCEGAHASSYRLMAIPLDSDSGAKIFCADESGTLKSIANGEISSCFSRGEVIDTATTGIVE